MHQALLKEVELLAALSLIASIGRAADSDSLRRAILRGIRSLIPGHIAGYNEVDLARGRIWAISDPEEAGLAMTPQAMGPYLHEHPVVAKHEEGYEQALAISDLIDRDAFRATQLYQRVYRPMRIEDQISVLLTSGNVFSALAVCRSTWGFSSRDRAFLDLLRPHLANALDAARARDFALRLGPAVWGGDLAAGVMIIGSTGRIDEINDAAGRLLDRMGERPALDLPPDVLLPWLALRRRGRGGRHLGVPTARGEVTLEAFRDSPSAGQLVITLHGDHPEPLPEPISEREREVLELIAAGLTDRQVALRLDIAIGTVRKHVEHARQKLGVHTRSAAIGRVLGAQAGAA